MTLTGEEKIGMRCFRFQELPSTNDTARSLFHDGVLRHGDVVLCQYQTKGRGQEQANWESEPGQNVLLSCLLEPAFLEAEQQIYLNMAICLSVADTLRENAIACTIKWPNDILAGQGKVCGILIENGLIQDRIRYSVVGIGLNVNQKSFAASGATSLTMIGGRSFETGMIFDSLMNHLNLRWNQMKAGEWSTLRTDYDASLYGFGTTRQWKQGRRHFSGIMKGVDDSGRLVLDSDGQILRFHNKEVQWITD